MCSFSCVLWAIFWSFPLLFFVRQPAIFLITEAKMPQKLIPNHRTINSKQLLIFLMNVRILPNCHVGAYRIRPENIHVDLLAHSGVCDTPECAHCGYSTIFFIIRLKTSFYSIHTSEKRRKHPFGCPPLLFRLFTNQLNHITITVLIIQ